MIDDDFARAGDHDFHCVHLTPSVNLLVDVKTPRTLEDDDGVQQSYYKGVPSINFYI